MGLDLIVVGAGHGGCEAALAAARVGARVGLVTLRADRIAQMSCNPAIGGVGKGHLVREIDALGGAMAHIADATGIQFRRLNASRGAAVRSTRCQSDSDRYRAAMTELVTGTAGIELIIDEALSLVIERDRVVGIDTRGRGVLRGGAVVITTGTFLNGLCHVGEEQFRGGRMGESPVAALSDSLRAAGIHLGRFKTGTTPRLAGDSIDWERLRAQPGDDPPPHFSFDEPVENALAQIDCHLTQTTAATHEIIRGGLDRSPLFCGVIKGTGPRYCPSIEDKVVRFAERDSHTIFLEPEGLDSDRVYPNGTSTSLPRDVQAAFLHTIPGLEHCRVLAYGYAVEYDYAPPQQLSPSLMSEKVPGLFLAGQINGTSGYEEAAAQGLIAGVNGARFVDGSEPLVLGRHQAYLGVMIDDLVTKGVDEPYRLFTSRAEHRLVLRESNAEERLVDIARDHGLVDQRRLARAHRRREQRQRLCRWLEGARVGRPLAANLGLDEPDAGLMRAVLLRRPEIGIECLLDSRVDPIVAGDVEEKIKYAGYIARERREIARVSQLEQLHLPPNLSFLGTPGLSTELQEKLERVRPATLGQASRIPGMTPAAISLLRVRCAVWPRAEVSRETSQ